MTAILASLIALASFAQSGLPKVYNEDIDPMTQIDEALATATSSGKYVICQVGGNWCPWCLRFADFISKDSEISKLVNDNYVYIHVNYNPRKSDSPEKKKVTEAMMQRLGNPGRFGYPVFVVLDSDGNVIHIQDSSFLEDGNGYSKDKVMRFFKAWTPANAKATTQCSADNEVIKAIMDRRSIRKYKDTPVEHDKLELIAQCGINAPNGLNQQKWAIRVVEDKTWIEETTEIFKKINPDFAKMDKNFKNMYRNAPNVICIATPDGVSSVDAGMLGENMMLAAHSLGLGTCCLGSSPHFLNSNAEFKPYVDKLNLPDGYKLCIILAVGYPDESPEAKPRDESKIEYIR